MASLSAVLLCGSANCSQEQSESVKLIPEINNSEPYEDSHSEQPGESSFIPCILALCTVYGILRTKKRDRSHTTFIIATVIIVLFIILLSISYCAYFINETSHR